MRLCFIGDSFVNGTGDPERLGWVGRVCASVPVASLTVYNLGIRRDTSADILARWRDEAERRLAADCSGRLVFSFGVNDCCQGLPPSQSLANAQSILGLACRRWPVLMVGPPAIDDDAVNDSIAALSAALRGVCGGLAVPFLDLLVPLRHDPLWQHEVAAGDGAHPGAAGYQRLADLVMAWPAWRDWVAAAT